jgi:hypothetical protein
MLIRRRKPTHFSPWSLRKLDGGKLNARTGRESQCSMTLSVSSGFRVKASRAVGHCADDVSSSEGELGERKRVETVNPGLAVSHTEFVTHPEGDCVRSAGSSAAWSAGEWIRKQPCSTVRQRECDQYADCARGSRAATCDTAQRLRAAASIPGR